MSSRRPFRITALALAGAVLIAAAPAFAQPDAERAAAKPEAGERIPVPRPANPLSLAQQSELAGAAFLGEATFLVTIQDMIAHRPALADAVVWNAIRLRPELTQAIHDRARKAM